MSARNEPVPSPLPGQAAYNTLDSSRVAQKSGVIFASQSRTPTGASGGSASGVYVSEEMQNSAARGVRLTMVCSPTGAATGTATFRVQVPDEVNGTWINLDATGFIMNGTGASGGIHYTIYPGLSGIADTVGTGANSAIVNQHIGPRWRLQVTMANAALTFTVGGDYLV